MGLSEKIHGGSPLDGAFFHLWKSPDKSEQKYENIHRQGQIIGVFQNTHLCVRVYSFLDGRPTNVELLPLETAYDGRMVFYVDDIEWEFGMEKLLPDDLRKINRLREKDQKERRRLIELEKERNKSKSKK